MTTAEFEGLNSLFGTARDAIFSVDESFMLNSHLLSDLGVQLPLHLSLSCPCVLKTEQKAGFLETIRERIRKARIPT